MNINEVGGDKKIGCDLERQKKTQEIIKNIKA